MRISKHPSITVTCDSIEVGDISDAVLREKIAHILLRRKVGTVRAKIFGSFTFNAAEYGQTKLAFSANVGCHDKTEDAENEEHNDRATVRRTLFTSHEVDSLKLICNSLYACVLHMKKKFNQPNVIDNRRREYFRMGELRNPHPLTEQELGMLASLKASEDEVRQGARRVAGTLKDPVEKFLLFKSSRILSMTRTRIDASAERLFTQLWVIDTYERNKLHTANNGVNFPYKLWRNIDNTRSQQYSIVLRFPPPLLPRLFEGWRTWQKCIDSEGRTQYRVGFIPIDRYEGSRQQISASMPKHIDATSIAMHIITEIAPNVCTWTKLQIADLKGW